MSSVIARTALHAGTYALHLVTGIILGEKGYNDDYVQEKKKKLLKELTVK